MCLRNKGELLNVSSFQIVILTYRTQHRVAQVTNMQQVTLEIGIKKLCSFYDREEFSSRFFYPDLRRYIRIVRVAGVCRGGEPPAPQ